MPAFRPVVPAAILSPEEIGTLSVTSSQPSHPPHPDPGGSPKSESQRRVARPRAGDFDDFDALQRRAARASGGGAPREVARPGEKSREDGTRRAADSPSPPGSVEGTTFAASPASGEASPQPFPTELPTPPVGPVDSRSQPGLTAESDLDAGSDLDRDADFDADDESGDEGVPSTPSEPAATRRPIPRRILDFLVRHFAFLFILIGFAAVCAPGLFIRVYPMYGDEIDLAHRYIPPQIKNPEGIFSVTTTHFGMHNLDFEARGWFMKATGYTRERRDVIMRVFNIGVGMALLMAVYWFGSARWDRRVGLTMAFLVAFSHYNLFLTIMGYYCNETALAILASVALLLGALQTSGRWRAILALVLSAFFATLSFMLYFTGRMLIGGIALIWFHEYIQRRDFLWRRGWMLALWVLVFGLLMLKPYDSVKKDSERGEARQRQTSLMYKNNLDHWMRGLETDNVFEAYFLNIKESLLVYFRMNNTYLVYGTPHKGVNTYHAYETSTPYVDRLSGLLLAVGILLALWRWRDIRFGALLALWLFYNVVPGGLTVLNAPPYHPRAHAGMLFAWMLAALPLGLMLVNVDKLAPWLRRYARPVVSVSVAAILATLAFYNIHLFYKYHNNFAHPTVAHYRMFDDMYRYYYRLGPTTMFVAAETPYALLSWTSFRTTHEMQPPRIVGFDAIKPKPGKRLTVPSDKTMVVFLARTDREKEVRDALAASGMKWREITEIEPRVPDQYTLFITGSRR